MIYYNDSSQVRKCLNYQEFSTEYCDCVCVHKSIKSMREKYANKTGGHLKQKNRLFEENEMYISRYKMDFKTPFRVQAAQPSINHLNIERLCPIKQSPKIFYDDQKKSISFTAPKETNCSGSERRESSFKQPEPIKLKQKKKRSEVAKINLKKNLISNQTIPVMKSFSNLKDHFPDGKSIELACSPRFNDENNQLNQLSSKDNLTENKLVKPGSAFNEEKKQLPQQPSKYNFIKNKLMKAGSTINEEKMQPTKQPSKDNFIENKFLKQGSSFKPISPSISDFSSDIELDGYLHHIRKKSATKIDSTFKNKNEDLNVKELTKVESNQKKSIESESYLTRKKSASKIDSTLKSKHEDSNVKEKKKEESNQKKLAYFVEYLQPKNQTDEKNWQITKQKNTCRHINLVCEICLDNFNFNKRKLYQFDLSNLSKDILVQKI